MAVSASVHTILAALLEQRRSPARQEVAPGDAFEVALLERRPGRAAVLEALPAAPASPAADALPPAGQRPPTPPRRTSRPPAIALDRPPEAPGGDARARAGPAPGSAEWLEAEGLEPGQAPPRGAQLGPVLGGSLQADEVPVAAQAAPRPEGREEAAARAQARLDAGFADERAADQARYLPDPYWLALRDELEHAPPVAWEVLQRGPPEDAVVSAGRVGQALAAWQRQAEQWARGARGGEAAPAPGAPRSEERAGPGGLPSLRAEGDEGPENRLFVTELVTRVEIEQAKDGAVVGFRVVRTSGNAVHDRLVLARLEELAPEARDRLGPPPEQGRRTRWAVRTRFELVPPLPVVGCGFDAWFRPSGCFYPLQRRVKSSARLERVFPSD